MRVTHKTFEKN